VLRPLPTKTKRKTTVAMVRCGHVDGVIGFQDLAFAVSAEGRRVKVAERPTVNGRKAQAFL
jgi:hypothetical protein